MSRIVEERFEDGQSGWIDHEVNRRLGGLLFSRCTVTAYPRTGKRVSRNKEGNCRFTSIALIPRQTRTVNDTRRSLTRVHVEFSCVNIYIYICTYAWWCLFFLFETVFRDLSSQTVDSIKGNWSSLLTIDGRFCRQLNAKWWTWKVYIVQFWHWAGTLLWGKKVTMWRLFDIVIIENLLFSTGNGRILLFAFGCILTSCKLDAILIAILLRIQRIQNLQQDI